MRRTLTMPKKLSTMLREVPQPSMRRRSTLNLRYITLDLLRRVMLI